MFSHQSSNLWLSTDLSMLRKEKVRQLKIHRGSQICTVTWCFLLFTNVKNFRTTKVWILIQALFTGYSLSKQWSLSGPVSVMENLWAEGPSCNPKPTYHKMPKVLLNVNTEIVVYKKQLIYKDIYEFKWVERQLTCVPYVHHHCALYFLCKIGYHYMV